MDNFPLTPAPNTADALPTALPTTTSTTTVHGYKLLIFPPEPVSYNTTNDTTSTMTNTSYPQTPSAPNATYPSPKKVKDLAGIIFPSILGGGAVIGWGIGWYLWKDIESAVTDFPETNVEDVARDFIEVAKANRWEETVRRKKCLDRYRRMSQLEGFALKQARKKRGTRFTKAQWSKVEATINEDRIPFDPPPPPDCAMLCGRPSKPTHHSRATIEPKPSPPRPRTSRKRTRSPTRTTRTSYRSGKTRYSGMTRDWPIWDPPTRKQSWPAYTPESLRPPGSDETDSKGKGRATARDTDTDYKSNWYSKTVDPDTLTTTTPKQTRKVPPGATPTEAPPPTPAPSLLPPPSPTTPPAPSLMATSTHQVGKPPPPWYTQGGPNNPPHPRAPCNGFNFKECCIYIAGLEIKCFPYQR